MKRSLSFSLLLLLAVNSISYAGNDCPPTNSSGQTCTSLNGVASSSYSQTGANTYTGKQTYVTPTTSTASDNYPAGTAPTSPVEGDIWNDSTQKSMVFYVDAIKRGQIGDICEETATQTVAASVTETSMIVCGVGTKTLPASFWTVGKRVRIKIGGVYSTPATSTGTATFKIKYGSTVIATVTTAAFPILSTNLRWSATVDIICRTTGASGTVLVDGLFTYDGTVTSLTIGDLTNAGAATTIDTTASSVLDGTWTWSNNTASQTVSSTVGGMEVLN